MHAGEVLLAGDQVAVAHREAAPKTGLDVVGADRAFSSSSMRQGMTCLSRVPVETAGLAMTIATRLGLFALTGLESFKLPA